MRAHHAASRLNGNKNNSKIGRIGGILLFILTVIPGVIYGQDVSDRFASNPTSLEWLTTETPHFKIVFPKRYTENWKNIGPVAEAIYAEFETALGTAPDNKITLYFNDEDEVVSGIRALGTDESESLWNRNAYRQNIPPAQQNLRDALRYEIAVAFQEEIRYFPVDYYFYVFSNPQQEPWSDGMPAYLTVSQETPYDIRWMRNYWYTLQEETNSVYRSEESTNIILGRSQIRFFNDMFTPDSLRPMYKHRPSLAGLVDYFDFEPAFKKASGISYDDFYSRWKKEELEDYERQKKQVNANTEGKAFPLLSRHNKVREYVGINVDSSATYAATITLPVTGRLLQQLSIVQGSKTGSDAVTVIKKGFFHPVMAWNPVKREVVFAQRIYNDKGNYRYDLFASDVNGNTIRQLTDNKHAVLPSFSPEGNRLAYVSTKGGASRIRIRNLRTANDSVIYNFGGQTVGRIFWHPGRDDLLISYREQSGTYRVGVLDVGNQQFSAFLGEGNVPLNAQWAAGGNRVYFNGLNQQVPNVFTGSVSGVSLSDIKPVISVFQGAELWDVLEDSAGNTQILAKTLGTYNRGQVTLFPGNASESTGEPEAFSYDNAGGTGNAMPADNDKAVSTTTEASLKSYNSFANIRWEQPFPVPYYLNSGDFGLAGYASLYEPLRTHEFGYTGILSLADPVRKSYFYSSYTNNSFRPRLELNYNHFPSASDWFGTSQEVETTDVIAASSLWKINALSRGYSNWYLGLLLRHQAFDYFSEETLRRNHPNIFFDNRLTRQTDLRLSLAWRILKPYRHTLIHPLDGTGVRLQVTGSEEILGSQTQYARFSLESYTVLPAGGNNRIYLYGNGALDLGEPAGRDYLAFTDNGNYRLPDPDFIGSINPGLGRYIRGYTESVLGERFLFGTAEYRIPLQLDSSKKLLGFIPPARMAFALFLDGGILDGARTAENATRTEYRSSFGAELKRVFSFGGSFKFTYELGIAQPFDQPLAPEPYFNVKAAIPF